MLKVFVDSSVLIAGAGSGSGASRAVLTMAEIGLFQLLVSPQVLDECERNLRKKLPKALPVFAQLLASIDPEVAPEPPAEKLAQWELVIAAKDAPILGAAVLAGADRLLTLDEKDFTVEVGKISSINIQSPSDFIQQIRQAIGQGLA